MTTDIKRRPRMTTVEVRQIVDAYNAGEPIRAIAAHHNRSYGGVHNVLTTARVQLRERGRRREAAR